MSDNLSTISKSEAAEEHKRAAHGSDSDSEPEFAEIVDFPEGGTKAWLVVFGAWCGLFSCFGIWNSVGVFQAWLIEHQLKNYDQGTISWIFSVFSFLFFFCGVQIGPVFDKYGARMLVLAGSVLFIIALVLFSISKEYYQFMLTFGVLGGVSCSLIFTPSVTTVGHWFFKKRAFATGLAATSGGIGGIIFPIFFQQTSKTIGFGWSVRAMALMCAFMSVLAKVGLKGKKSKNSALIDLSGFKDIRFTFTAIAFFMIEWGLQTPISYLTTYGLSKASNASDEAFAYYLVAILNAGSVIGRWIPGWFADRFGRYNLMIINIALCTIFTFAIWLSTAAPSNTSRAPMTAYAVLFGLASGSGISLAAVCVSQICKTKDYGKRYGTIYSFGAIGTLTGQPIAGAILARTNGKDFTGLVAFCGACYVVCLVAFILVRGIGTNWKLRAVY
ncbi:major facilitator superfamily domain-containing protein [Dipodascopsis tothii]|uniref:major facilitator superfamily domain-containing protein n=1 Tax=Dipodascopsis tothii TaxID=44089 RepID=UPI0034CEAC33